MGGAIIRVRGRAGSRDPVGVTTISIGGGISDISQFQFYKSNRRKRNERAGKVLVNYRCLG